MADYLSMIPLALETVEKFAFFGPIIYPAFGLLTFFIYIFGYITGLGLDPDWSYYDESYILCFFLPNILSLPLMAIETYKIPLVAKQDSIVQVFDRMFAWIIMIQPVALVSLLIAYPGAIHNMTLSFYPFIVLVGFDFLLPLLHLVKTYTYIFL
ncbi:hypothetical protein FGO68_gene4942 [Halteria grandinella]|uniref:Uncharacterized protein n=1 Tax=Halteria grandinella TaxID=5974 RepID=A0A8J8NIS9_HALGN|nr:hypothetical protein FGO68_gene4942 [Halteria grandinella]